jgi:predicted nucleic acid-binding protein
MAQGKKSGKVIATVDAWIAATALAYEIPLVWHNGKHYSGVEKLTLICEPEP